MQYSMNFVGLIIITLNVCWITVLYQHFVKLKHETFTRNARMYMWSGLGACAILMMIWCGPIHSLLCQSIRYLFLLKFVWMVYFLAFVVNKSRFQTLIYLSPISEPPCLSIHKITMFSMVDGSHPYVMVIMTNP